MITTEEAYEIAKQKYLPRLVKAEMNQCFREGNFDAYALYQNIFFNNDPKVRVAPLANGT